GGGAAVGNALVRRWAETKPFPFLVLGSGEKPPGPGIPYRQVAWDRGGRGHPAGLSVREYARLSREFERGVTGFLRDCAREVEPSEVCVLHNDIAEGGNFRAIAAMGYRQAAIFHVDVVDYVSRIYLRDLLPAPDLARLWRGLERGRLSRLLPDVADLALGKQEACARHCELLIVPSRPMAEVLRRAYPWRTEDDVLVLPWGTIAEPEPPETEEVLRELRCRYDPGGRPVLLTLSRISPEKGQDLLLRALRLWERGGGEDLLVLICGAAAYMHGGSYLRTLERLARRLRRVEVRFPGYVAGAEKHAFFRLADLYVFPSRHESYGLTLMEALAAGLPVLTTDHRSAADLVRPEFGRVVPAEPRALLRGLQELLAEREELPRMGEAARAFARARPFAQAADALADHLLHLLAPEPARARG
ncbi:MAG: glycosyltransferase family 4 protein, partial [Candidatus Bipolaricaulota bacterium]|nr:glycosyltransferase family 4 protein [Candidatus Bipolaricaulota bacterium]